MTLRKHIVLVAAFLLAGLSGWAQQALRGVVKDAVTGEPVPGAAITQGKYWALTDSLGTFQLKAPQNGELTITCLGYKTLKTRPLSSSVYRLQPDIFALQEVVVTAQENHGLTSASKIGADAIAHIQPSSIADVLELLPGGTSSNPVLGTPQIVNLRAAGSLSSDYATSALGTQFTIDGKPLNNNANLQYTPAWSELGSNYVNLGTDMRTIGTEDIESINVVRGIASVEHGDLTSGLIQVKRIKGGNDFRARFKSDMTSKLVYAGKGWEWGGKDRRTLNVSVNFLDARSDPRNVRQNYKRLTGSLRFGRTWSGGEHFTQTVNTSLDYTGSFDNRKSDQDIDQLDGIPTETYKSTYNRFQLGADYHLQAKDNDAFFRSLAVNASLSYEKDLIDRWKNVILSSETPFSTAKEPGEYDAYMLPMRYEAILQVDGQPLYVFTSAVAQFQVKEHKFKVGADWNYDKNLGQGSIFDITRPLSTTMGSRPRAYYDIPADSQLALFLQENSRLKLGSFALEWMAGVRMSMLLGADASYAIQARPFLDPRANLRLEMPEALLGGYRFSSGIYAGAGLHTKFPTMEMLYPDTLYSDKIQMNYWPTERNLRRINMLLFTTDPVNKDLMPARNFKWEVGTDLSWNGWSLSADFFVEDMTSGFRGGSEYLQLIAKDYDEKSIDKSTLTGPPSLETTPYVMDTTLVAYGLTTNGSRTLKKGIEYTLTTARIPVVNTRLTVNGAWFLTQYMNSQPEYQRPSAVLDGKPYPYIGIYEKNDSYLYESFNTNFLFDTQVPRLGLVFSTSLQCTWFTGSQTQADDSRPVAYLDKNLERHPYTDEADADGVLHLMVRSFSSTLLEYRRIPFVMNVNLKATKKLFKDRATVSIFVNRLFTVAPDYEVNGVLKRRSSTPYFGMELMLNL
jgi:hypothetical protein